MAGDSAETSNKSNKSFYSTVFVLFFISKLYLKKFKQFSLGDLLVYIEQNYDENFRKYVNRLDFYRFKSFSTAVWTL